MLLWLEMEEISGSLGAITCTMALVFAIVSRFYFYTKTDIVQTDCNDDYLNLSFKYKDIALKDIQIICYFLLYCTDSTG